MSELIKDGSWHDAEACPKCGSVTFEQQTKGNLGPDTSNRRMCVCGQSWWRSVHGQYADSPGIKDRLLDIASLVGREFDFHGAHSNAFMLDGVAYEAVEDANDGYRSALDYVRVIEQPSGFFASTLARVRMESEPSEHTETWRLVDADDGHVWLTFGTNNYDDYYPCFVFEYAAKSPEHAVTTRLREDIGALALSARDEMIAKADESARNPIPLKHDGKDELWAMATQLHNGTWKAETITPLPMDLPALEVTGPVRAALEPNLLHAYCQLLERAKIESHAGAVQRAGRAEVRFA